MMTITTTPITLITNTTLTKKTTVCNMSELVGNNNFGRNGRGRLLTSCGSGLGSVRTGRERSDFGSRSGASFCSFLGSPLECGLVDPSSTHSLVRTMRDNRVSLDRTCGLVKGILRRSQTPRSGRSRGMIRSRGIIASYPRYSRGLHTPARLKRLGLAYPGYGRN